MNSIDILKDLAQRPMAEAEALLPVLDAKLLNAHPGHDNSIAWLLWHSAREIDVQLAALSGREQVWTAQGFEQRFGLGLDKDDMGFGHTAQQARLIKVDDADLLIEHLRAVIHAQVDYLNTLSEENLSEIVDEQWDPAVSRAARLSSISLDALSHVAQAAYITGMSSEVFESDSSTP